MAIRARDSIVAGVAALCRRRHAAGRDKGTTAIEYGLIAGVTSLAIIAGATALGSSLGGYFQGFDDYF
jgi:Flp pilus assembly pilin Flp